MVDIWVVLEAPWNVWIKSASVVINSFGALVVAKVALKGISKMTFLKFVLNIVFPSAGTESPWENNEYFKNYNFSILLLKSDSRKLMPQISQSSSFWSPGIGQSRFLEEWESKQISWVLQSSNSKWL